MINISVLMTCHNRRDQTLRCLQNLYKQKGINESYRIQVHLVDDGSSDNTGIEVKRNFPYVNVIYGNGDLYWNRGMHTAWEVAATAEQSDFYLWLNDDTEMYPDAVLTLLEAARQKQYQAIICGSIESPTKKGHLTYGGGHISDNTYVANYPDGSLKLCDIINGNCVLIAHSIYLTVGNLDWKFIHAIGDNDYGLRAKKLGIPAYSTGIFIASCAMHDQLPKWCLPKVRFSERIKNLYSPLGYSHPTQHFVYENRHFGLKTAVKHYLSIHLRVLIPSLWK